MAGIDLNAVDDGDAVPEEGSDDVCAELWRACAGPLVSLPRKGSVVVYLPQGHLQHTADAAPLGNVPPHVFCRVVDVKLLADVGTDDVYAQLCLVEESEDFEKRVKGGAEEGECADVEVGNGERAGVMTHMFCKTLTASDTSTHGGFSVPRRAAEDCFPPLDYKQQRPSQELNAKDLHGTKWRFRHIYRGQPRRHLLTTGWSAFVNKKKLVLGDAVLFLRGADGELRLGIRRSAQLKAGFPSPSHGPRINVGTFSDISRALLTNTTFHIVYNPRGTSDEFIIPYQKFLKSLTYNFSVGTRVKMRFENEDASDRCSGLISGFSDVDPVRWPGSKWRCLMVKWDGDFNVSGASRVSPWDIEPTGSISGSNCLSAVNMKRIKVGPTSNLEPNIPNAGYPSFGESGRLREVLQGQEIVGYRNPYEGRDPPYYHPSKIRHQPIFQRCMSTVSGSSRAIPVDDNGFAMGNSEFPHKSVGFDESIRFNEVLQGQEIFPSMPLCAGRFNNVQVNAICMNSDAVCVPNANRNWYSSSVGFNNLNQAPGMSSMNVSSPSSVFMFPQSSSRPPCSSFLFGTKDSEQVEAPSCNWTNQAKVQSGHKAATNQNRSLHVLDCARAPPDHSNAGREAPCVVRTEAKEANHTISSAGNVCKLFGFSLTETSPEVNELHVLESTPISRVDRMQLPGKSQNATIAQNRGCTEVSHFNALFGPALSGTPCFSTLL